MLIVASAGVTLIAMAYLEHQGKVLVNRSILYVFCLGFSTIGGWWAMRKIIETFF